jgi:hypothetical protein
MAHAEELKALVELVEFQLPSGFDAAFARTRVVASLLRLAKDNALKFKNLIPALYQRCVKITIQEESVAKDAYEIGDFYIPIDGDAPEAQANAILEELPFPCRQVPIPEVVWLSSFIDVQKSASDVDFPLFEAAPKEVPKAKTNWHGFAGKTEVFKEVKICRKTMRPYAIVGGRDWQDIYHQKFGYDTPIFNGDACYGNFVVRFGAYPTLDEYAMAIYMRLVGGSCVVSTLPTDFIEICKLRISEFEKAANGVSALEFARIFNSSLARVNREAIEKK